MEGAWWLQCPVGLRKAQTRRYVTNWCVCVWSDRCELGGYCGLHWPILELTAPFPSIRFTDLMREKGSKQSWLMVLKRASTFCLFPSFIPKQILVILQLSAHYSEGKHPSPSSLWSDFLSHSESPAFCLSLTFSAFHGLWASLSHVRFLTFFTWWLYFLGKVKEKTRPSTSPPTDTDFSAGSFRRSAHWL